MTSQRTYEVPNAPSTYSDHYMLVDKSGAVSATKVRIDALKTWVLEDVVPGYAGSNVSTQANGAANAGQKIVTVDTTTGFLPGAPVAYTLVGGVIETNTVDTVDSPTQLTLTVNIGTGGIADNTFIMVVNLGALVSTGAVAGASSVEQVFTKGIELPVPTGAASHFLSSFSTTFNAVVNPISTWGYNSRRGARDVAGEGTAAWTIEGDYYDTAAGSLRHMAETYFTTSNDAATNGPRWFALTADREDISAATGYASWHFLIPANANGSFNILDTAYGNLFNFGGQGQLALHGSSNAITFNAANPYIQATTNNPLALIANSKYVYVSNAVNGCEFGDQRDTNIYCSAANTLKTDDNLIVALDIELDGALNHDGTTVGFYGVAPTTRLLLATGAGATVDNVITALQTLGLVKQS